jgi:hypothetical protein
VSDLGAGIASIRAYGYDTSYPQVGAFINSMTVEGTFFTPEADIATTTPVINPDQRLRLFGSVTGLTSSDQASYEWTSTHFTAEELIDRSIIACQPNLPVLVIRENLLSPGEVIDFTLTVTDEVTGLVGSDTITIEVNTPPSGGTIEVSPHTGIPLDTLFTLTAPGWTDPHAPLYYQFFYRTVGSVDEIALTNLLVSDTAEVYLPAGELETIVKVFDSMGASSKASTFITLYDDPVTVINSIVSDVVVLNLSNGIANSLDAKLSSAVEAVDDLNDNNDVSAVNKLEAFINAVQAQAGNKIPTEAAAELIAQAEAVIDLITQ